MAKDIIKTMRENSKKGIIGYASNVTKSIGYASFEKLKKMNPAVAEIDQSNNEIFKTIYKDTINYRTTYKRSMTAIKKSKFYEAADIGFNALKEDLMTGNFYNKQRMQEIEDKQMEKFMSNDSFDLDFDEGNNDYTDVDGSNVKPLNSNAEVIGNMNANSAANANTISMSVLRSAQAQSEVSIKNTQLLHTFNIKAFGQVNANLDAINSNMGSMMKYLDNNISSHLSNSQQFFEAVTPMLQDQTALLRQIVENTKPPEPKKTDNKSERTTFYDIAGAEGTPDFDLYAKQISKNVMNLIDENTLGMGGLLNSMGDDVNILSSFAANPYGLMLDFMMDKLTPKQIEKGFNELNKSIGGFFGSFITKMNTYTKSDNPLLSTIGKILGVSTNRKNYIDTSKYMKDKVDWNGKAEKALTEIIPNKLEQIISILSGSEEKTYDYEKGQYLYLSDLQKDYDRFSDSFWKSASRDIIDEMTTLMNQNIAFDSKKQRDQLYEDMRAVFKKLYEDNELLDINNKDLSKDYMDYNVSTEDNMRILQTLMQNVPRSQWHLFNKEINNTYKNERDSYERVEKEGKYNILFNNSGFNQYSNKVNGEKNKDVIKTPFNTNLNDIYDKTGHNIFYYLQNMYKELNYIRRYGSAGTGSGQPTGGRGRNRRRTNFDEATEELIRITDEARERERRESNLDRIQRENREEESFQRDQERRMNRTGREGYNLVNLNDLEGSQINAVLKQNINANKEKDNIYDRRDQEKNNLLNKVIAAKKLSEKTEILVERINTISKKPMEIITGALDKADQRLFELIYGKEGMGEEKDIKGFLDAMLFQLNNSFNKFNSFIEEKILNPLKDKLGIDEDKSLFKGLMEKFGIDEKIQNAKDWMKDVTAGVRENLKAVYTDVKDTYINTGKEIISPITSNVKTRNSFKDNEGYNNMNQNEMNDIMQKNREQRGRDFYNTLKQQPPQPRQEHPQLTQNILNNTNKPNINVQPSPFMNIRNNNERNVADTMLNNLNQSINETTRRYFRDMNMPGFSEGGYNDKDRLAVVGKGEYVLSKDKFDQLSQILGDRIRRLASSKRGIAGRDNLNGEARKLYERMVYEMGAENIDPNVIMSLVTEGGEAANAFSELETEEESKKILEMLNRVKYAFSQRNEGKIDDSGKYTQEAKDSGVTDVFSDAFKVYQNTLQKTMDVLMGQDPKTEKKNTFEGMGDILKDAKIHSSELVTGGLLGAGASLLTGFLGGPLLGAGIGASIALTRRSTMLQDKLFGKQKLDKDGNPTREGGIIPKDIYNKIAKVAPDLKKYGIFGAVTGLLPLVPFGPVPGLIMGSAVAFAKHNTRIQEMLFGDKGLLDKEKLQKFKDEKLGHILAGAGVGAAASILGVPGPFGLVGRTLIGSAVGFASTTEQFQRMLFGEYDESTKTYKGGVIPYLKNKVVSPLMDFTKEKIDVMFNWIQRDIINPLRDAVQPFIQQGKNMFKWLMKGPQKLFDMIGNKVKAQFDSLAKRIAKSTLGFIGRKASRTAGKVISAPARAIGAVGRNLKRRQIKNGTAEYMTAEERLQYMEDEQLTDFYYNEGKRQSREALSNVSQNMSKRFGKKEMLKVRALMDVGDYKAAKKVILNNFGDVRDPESIQVMNSMLDSLNQFQKLKGERYLSKSTYGDKKEIGREIKNQYEEAWNKYNSVRPEKEQVTFDEYMTMEKGDRYTKNKKGYNNKNIDEMIASASNEQLKELTNYYNASTKTDSEYKKMRKDSIREINKVLNDEDLDLDPKYKKIIAKSLNNGEYDAAINYLDKVIKEKGVSSSKYSQYDKLKTTLEDFKVTDNLRLDKNKANKELDKMLQEMGNKSGLIFGKDITRENFFERARSEIKVRNKRGIIKNDIIKDTDPQTNIQIITDRLISLLEETKNNRKTAEDILNTLKENRVNRTEEDINRERTDLNERVYRNEQQFTRKDNKRIELLKKLGYNNIEEAPYNLRVMNLRYLTIMANDYSKNKTKTDEYKLDMSSEYGYESTPDFINKMDRKQSEEYRKKVEKYNDQLKRREKPVNPKPIGKGEGDEVTSTLDAEGNEIRMKKDGKTGQMEADLSDSSTKKSIAIAKETRETQMKFYNRFLEMFKREDTEEKEVEKKKNNWLTKLLAGLGIGKGILKSLFGGATGMFGKLALLGRAGLGMFGKGLLVLGGLMYAPQLIDLFKTTIAPQLSESWKNDIKPWLVNEGIPMMKDGLVALVKEIPNLLKETVKFITGELIPSLLKGIYGSDEEGKKVVTETTLKSINNKAGDYAEEATEKAIENSDNVAENVVKNTTKQPSKLTKLLSKISGGKSTEIAEKISTKTPNIVKKGLNVGKKGFKVLWKSAKWGLDKATNLIPGMKTAKKIGKFGTKAFKKVTDFIAKPLSKIYKSGPEMEAIMKNGGILTNMLNSLAEGLRKLLSNGVVKNLLGKTKAGRNIAEALGEKFVPRLLEIVEKRAAKQTPEALAAILGKLGTKKLFTIAFAAYDFVDGYNNAPSMLGITGDVTVAGRIVCGVVNAIKGLFIIGSLIPMDVIVDALVAFLKEIGVDSEELDDFEERREQSKEEVKKYNEENGTDYSLTEYNEKNPNTKNNTLTTRNNKDLKVVEKKDKNGKKKLVEVEKTDKDKKKEVLNQRLNNPYTNLGHGDGPGMVNGNPYYSQKRVGGSLHNTMYSSGCGPTATAMALSKVTGRNIKPETIAKDGLKNGSWDSEGARAGLFNQSKYGVKTVSSDGDFNKFDKMVSAGIPTTVSGTIGKGEDSPYTSAGHIVTVFGKDKNGNYLVNDPRGEQYSGSYTKEQLMNGFTNSWSFGKGEGDETEKAINNNLANIAKPRPISVMNSISKQAINVLDKITATKSDLIDVACKSIQDLFIKLFNDSNITNLLGTASNSNYSASSSLLANFVPQIIVTVKNNCKGNGNYDSYLRAIIQSCNIGNLSNVINRFIQGYNNPANFIGNSEVYTNGMKVAAGIFNVVNNILVFDKVLTSNDWGKLITNYVLPIYGESKQEMKEMKDTVEKQLKSLDIKSISSGQIAKQSIQQMVTDMSKRSNNTNNNSNQNIFSKLFDGVKTVGNTIKTTASNIFSGVKNTASNLYNSAKNVLNNVGNWIGGLFGRGEYVGKGKEVKEPKEIEITGDAPNATPSGNNNFPYFSQYGEYTDDKQKPDLAKSGCGPTSAAMVLSKVKNQNITPKNVVDKLTPLEYNMDGSSETMFTTIGRQYGVNVQPIKDFNKVRQYAKKGVPMVISGEGGKVYGNNKHIVAGFGKNKYGYIINDPSSVKDSKIYQENDVRQGFQEAWVFGNNSYLQDLKDSEQVYVEPNREDIAVGQSTDLFGMGADPTTLTYKNGFPYWSQVAFGGNILQTGCGPTSAAMILSFLKGQSISPETTCREGNGHGYSYNSGGNGTPQVFEYLGKKYGIGKVEKLTNFNEINKRLREGHPIIVDGQRTDLAGLPWAKRCMKSMYSPAGHYSVAVGMDGDDYIMNDPRGSKFSGRRPASHVTKGFKFAVQMGDKVFNLDKSKISELGIEGGEEGNLPSADSGTTDGTTDSGTTQETSTPDFFSDMLTAVGNFSKKLFGFETSDSVSPSNNNSDSDTSSDSDSDDSSDESFEAGKTYDAEFTAYFPYNSKMEGGYYDKKGKKLDPSKRTCAAPSFVPYGTKLKVDKTGTDCDGKIYTVNDTGEAIVKNGNKYRIDILKGSQSACNEFGRRKGTITFQKSSTDKDKEDTNKDVTTDNKNNKNKTTTNKDNNKKTKNNKNNKDNKNKTTTNKKTKDNNIVGHGDGLLDDQLYGTGPKSGGKIKLWEKVIGYAKAFIHKMKYKYGSGAIDNNGLTTDCSHFTAHVLNRAAGLNISPGSAIQRTLGKEVTGKAQAGDIVTWKGHAGLVADSNGNMIDAGSGTVANFKSYTQSYWGRRKGRMIRRVLNNPNQLVDPKVENYNKSIGFNGIVPSQGGQDVEDANPGDGNSGGSKPINGGATFPKYALNEQQKLGIARIVSREQSGREGRFAEASLIANLTDKYGDDKATVNNIVAQATGAWFSTRGEYKKSYKPPQDAIDAVQSCIIDGKRTLPRYIDEHDCFSDIKSVTTDGKSVSKTDRSAYVQHKTKIKNRFKSSGTFYSFPDSESDPFYYTSDKLRTKWGEGCFDSSGNGSAGNSDSSSGSTDGGTTEEKSVPDFFSDMLTAVTNFSKKLFGFETEATTTTTDSSTTTDDSTPSEVKGSDTAEKVWNFYTSAGYTPEATAGIMGNFQAESGVDPTCIQSNGKGPAAGIAQWENINTKSARWKEMADYAKSKGKDWTDLLCQLQFVNNELAGNSKDTYTNSLLKKKVGGLDQFKALTDVNQATKVFEESFERAGVVAMKKRQRYANEFYKIYKNGTNNDTNKDTSTDNKKTTDNKNNKDNNKKTKDNKNNKDNNKKTKDNKNKTTTNKNNNKLNNIVGHGDGGIDSFFTSTLNAVKTSDFGIDNDNYHTGVDYATKEGTDIVSPIEGKVVEKKYDKRGFGNTMVIKDKNDKFHRFAHMKDTPSFGLGDKIEKNSVIGKVGNTGNSSGSHLHYQVTDKKGVSINPKDYTGKGGSENKLEDAIITFKESKEKVRVSLDKEDVILRNGTIGKPLIIDEDTPKASVPKNETPIKVPNGSAPGVKVNNPLIVEKGNIPKVEVPTVTKPIDNPIVNIPENNNETYNKKTNSTETNNMIRLVNIIINLLTKVTDNTANIATIVDILKDMMTNYQGKTTMGKGVNDTIEQKKKQSKTYPNKYRSSTQKSQVNQIKNLMQKSLTSNSTDDTNLEYILNALETLATE